MEPFRLHVTSGLAPPGPARLFGGPMDGTVFPAVYRTQWLAVANPETPDSPEWYMALAPDKDKAVVYSHLSVKDAEVDWAPILGYAPWSDDDDEGDEPYVTV